MTRLRNWWPGWRWVAVFVAGGMLISGSAAIVSAEINAQAQSTLQRQFAFCRSVGQPWVQISEGHWACDMSAYWKQAQVNP